MEVMSGMENKFAEHRWQNYRAEVRRYRGREKKILKLVKDKPLFAAAA
jgi:hypothetical protein